MGARFSRKEEAERNNCCLRSSEVKAGVFPPRELHAIFGVMGMGEAYPFSSGFFSLNGLDALGASRPNTPAKLGWTGVPRRSAGTICGRPVWLAGYGLSSPLYKIEKKGQQRVGSGGPVFEPEVGWGLPGLGQSFICPTSTGAMGWVPVAFVLPFAVSSLFPYNCYVFLTRLG